MASFGLTATQAEAATAPRQVFMDACKSIKGQAADASPETTRAKATVKAIIDVAGGTTCEDSAKAAAALTELDISGKELTEISAVAFLRNLTTLNISNNKVSDISAVKGLTKLTKLNLAQNTVTDISAVAALTALDTLNISKNSVNDLGAIKDHPITASGSGAGIQASVRVDAITIVTRLTHLNDAIPTDWTGTGIGAAVIVNSIPIVTGFDIGEEDAITTSGGFTRIGTGVCFNEIAVITCL